MENPFTLFMAHVYQWLISLHLPQEQLSQEYDKGWATSPGEDGQEECVLGDSLANEEHVWCV